MLVPTTIALLAAASLVRAATHTIVVGANGNAFNPTSIITNPGDVITFSLYVALFPSILKRTDRSRYSQLRWKPYRNAIDLFLSMYRSPGR